MKKIFIIIFICLLLSSFPLVIAENDNNNYSEALAGLVNPDMLFISMTKIRNSDGETFDATSGNIQVAIDSTSSPGTVWVPSGTYNPPDTILIKEGITLDLCGATIKPLSAYGSIVRLEKDANFWNGFIDCKSIVMSDTDAAVYLSGFSGVVNGDTIQTIKNIRMDGKVGVGSNQHYYGCGVFLNAPSGICYRALFSRIHISGFRYGIRMFAHGGDIQENIFKYIGEYANYYQLYLEASGSSEISDNLFDMFEAQPGFANTGWGTGVTECNIVMKGDCHNNLFRSMFFWDYSVDMKDMGKMSLNLDASTSNNFVAWTGGNEGDGTPGNSDYIDAGTNNVLWKLPIYMPPSQWDTLHFLDDMQDAYHTTASGSGTWLGLESPYYLFTETDQIVNSKGNTFSDIQLALNDLEGQPGTVWVPKDTYAIFSPITVPEYAFLDLMGSTIKPTSAMNVITLSKGSMILNGIIDCTEVVLSDDQAAIRVTNLVSDYHLGAIIDNMVLLSSNTKGTGIYCLEQGQLYTSVCWVWSTRVYIDQFKYGVRLQDNYLNSGWDTYVNADVFRYIRINECVYNIYLKGSSGSEVSGHLFSYIICNPLPAGGTLICIYDTGGACLYFDKVWIPEFASKMRAYNRLSLEDHSSYGSFFELCGGTQYPGDYTSNHMGNWATRVKGITEGTPIPSEIPVLNETMIDDYYFQVQGGNPGPNKPNVPSGPCLGKPGILFTYETSTIDPNGGLVYYMWDWDDGTPLTWTGPFNSGQTATASHIWSAKGIYNIKVKAKDITGANSVWSDPLPIIMPFSFNKPILRVLELFFQRFIIPCVFNPMTTIRILRIPYLFLFVLSNYLS